MQNNRLLPLQQPAKYAVSLYARRILAFIALVALNLALLAALIVTNTWSAFSVAIALTLNGMALGTPTIVRRSSGRTLEAGWGDAGNESFAHSPLGKAAFEVRALALGSERESLERHLLLYLRRALPEETPLDLELCRRYLDDILEVCRDLEDDTEESLRVVGMSEGMAPASKASNQKIERDRSISDLTE